MKYFVYGLMLLLSSLLFLPKSSNDPIRNIPLLLIIIIIIGVIYLVRFIRYIVLMFHAKKFFEQKGMKLIKWRVWPAVPLLRSHYSMIFKNKNWVINVIFLIRRKKYIHYHFENIKKVEFYKDFREVYFNSNTYGPKFSKKVKKDWLANKNCYGIKRLILKMQKALYFLINYHIKFPIQRKIMIFLMEIIFVHQMFVYVI